MSGPLKRTKRKADLLSASPTSERSEVAGSMEKLGPKVKVVQDLISKATRDTTNGSYARVLEYFRRILEKGSGDDLYCWFSALARVASTVSFATHGELLDVVLSFDWYSPDSYCPDVHAAYSDAVVQAVAGSKNITFRVFHALARQLRCKTNAVGQPDWPATEETCLAIHGCIRRILALVPASAKVLARALEESFPHRHEGGGNMRAYVLAVLQVSVYCPETAPSLFDAVIERLLAMDLELGDNASAAAAEEDQTLFAFDDEMAGAGRVRAEERLKAQNMDDLMEAVFSFIDDRGLDKIPVDNMLHAAPDISFESFPAECSSQADFFRNLLHVFHARILPTAGCKFVQFLVFYACSKSPEVYSKLFLRSLQTFFKNRSVDQHLRSLAVVYIGSFVARLANLSAEMVRSVLLELCEWAREYQEAVRFTANNRPVSPDPEVHHLFYVVCNCIFYILCFRSRELLEADLDFNQQVSALVDSQLNPLLFVEENIRQEICSVSRLERVIDLNRVRAKAAENKRYLLSSKANLNSASRLADIVGVFPFDPYLLVAGDVRLSPLYKQWEDDDVDDNNDVHQIGAGVAEEEDEDDDSFCKAMSLGTPITGSFAECLSSKSSLSSSASSPPVNFFV